MRLDKLIIGSMQPGPSHQFKNLKNLNVDFDENHWVTVLIGWNGTGKSNVLEALAIIFRELIGPKKNPKIPFSFKLMYYMGNGNDKRLISIDHDPDRLDERFIIKVILDLREIFAPLSFNQIETFSRESTVRLKKFLDDEKNLPKYIFGYYSGESSRLHDVFLPYVQWYDKELRNGKDPGIKRLFYALPVHSQFVLLAFLIGESNEVTEVLKGNLGLDPVDGLESVLFVLRNPPWKGQGGDPRFWNAKGVVQEFLSRLYEIALAPIDTERRVSVSLWNEKTLKFKYLFIKNISALRELVGKQQPAAFFRDLESTYVSQLIEEVRIKVRLKKSDETLTFRELSEGEQQLLTVLGLLKFTKEEESLFLLDEPDTHLNPRWSVDYLGYLKKIINASQKETANSHVLLTTHNPLAIAELVKEQVQVLQVKNQDGLRQVIAFYPETDPRGMGYAAIVASDMFGIASTMDKPTQLLLEKQRILGGKAHLTDREQQILEDLNERLNKLGFRFFHPDDEYSRYLRLRNELLSKRFHTEEASLLATKVVDLSRETREDLTKELIDRLLSKK